MIDHIWNEEDIVVFRMDYGCGPEPVDGLRWTCLACGKAEEREKIITTMNADALSPSSLLGSITIAIQN